LSREQLFIPKERIQIGHIHRIFGILESFWTQLSSSIDIHQMRDSYSDKNLLDPELELHSEGTLSEDAEHSEDLLSIMEHVHCQHDTIHHDRNLTSQPVPQPPSTMEINSILVSHAVRPLSERLEMYSDEESKTESFDADDFSHAPSQSSSNEVSRSDLCAGQAFRDSIQSIRDAASRVETAMALDQLETIRQELRVKSSELQDQSGQVEELRALLALKENRMSTLELERDLYKADSSKLKKDLACLKAKSSLADIPTPCTVELENDDEWPVCDTSQSASSSHQSSVILLPQLRYVVTRPDLTQEGTSSIMEPSNPGLGNAPKLELSEYARWLQSKKVRYPLPCEKPSILCGASRYRGRGFLPFRKKVQPQGKAPIQPILDNSSGTSLQMHVDELSGRLKAAMDISEELRRRLAMISRYYESLIRKQQKGLTDLRSDRAKMEADLVSQISAIDLDRRKQIAALQQKLENAEMELKTYKTI
jgi:hypothetical protein